MDNANLRVPYLLQIWPCSLLKWASHVQVSTAITNAWRGQFLVANPLFHKLFNNLYMKASVSTSVEFEVYSAKLVPQYSWSLTRSHHIKNCYFLIRLVLTLSSMSLHFSLG